MNIVMAEYVNKQKYDAGNKARADVIKIALAQGYRHLPLYRSGSNKIIIIINLLLSIIKAMIITRLGDTILLQYPYSPNIVNKCLFNMLWIGKKARKYKLKLIIHDIKSIRSIAWGTKTGEIALQKEMKLFNKFDAIIVHNTIMKDLLIKNAFHGTCLVLKLFDYLSDGELAQITSENDIIIAGNLNEKKCRYIYKLGSIKGLMFNLYGIGYEEKNITNLHYCGKYKPDELIQNLKGRFGLVWDGEEINTCTGTYGNYLRVNNPHKLSLYIAAGLPVVVWKYSAVASFVETEGIGYCVESLYDLPNLLKKTTEKEYELLKKRVMDIRTHVIGGDYLKLLL